MCGDLAFLRAMGYGDRLGRGNSSQYPKFLSDGDRRVQGGFGTHRESEWRRGGSVFSALYHARFIVGGAVYAHEHSRAEHLDWIAVGAGGDLRMGDRESRGGENNEE